MPEIARVWQANLRVYGADKVWKQMNREGIGVARCTVERLMRRLGLQGARRGKTVRTTVPDRSAPCPLDRAERVNLIWTLNSKLGHFLAEPPRVLESSRPMSAR